jgi:hypothetical protein
MPSDNSLDRSVAHELAWNAVVRFLSQTFSRVSTIVVS